MAKSKAFKNGQSPASPTSFESEELGLTKREAFAMAAMQGLMANSFLTDKLTDPIAGDVDVDTILAVSAVNQADALLKELEK